jgi:hypothetical protein
MFTFINAAILTTLAVAIIPLLIHLFNKERKKKIKFSTVRFLNQLQKKRLKRVKIFEYLLIIIRTIIIIAIIMSFARPTLTSKAIFSSNDARNTAVIIVDDGVNMQRYDELGNRFNRAKDLITRLANDFNPEDEVFILRSTKPDEMNDNIAQIMDLSGSFRHGDWTSSLIEALKIFNEHPNFNQELYIISDFEFAEKSFELMFDKFSDTRIFLLKVGSNPIENAGIDTVEIKNQILEQSRPISLDVHVYHQHLIKKQEVELHLFVNEKRMAHRRVLLKSDKKEIVPLSFQIKSTGIIKGYVEISDDNLIADNRYYFSLQIPSEIKVLYVDNNPTVFIKAALSSLAANSAVSYTQEKYNSWAKQNFHQYDIILLSDFSDLSSSILERVKRFVSNNGTLILLPGISTTPVEFNRASKTLGLSLKIKEIINSTTEENFFHLKQPDLSHPLFKGLFRVDEPDPVKPRFYSYFKFFSDDSYQSILSYQNNDPFLVQIRKDKGLIFIFSSCIDERWTDIQYRGIFVPLLSRLFYMGLATSSLIQEPFYAEQEKAFISNQYTSRGEFYLETPDGDKNRISPRALDQNLVFNLTQLYLPGLYKIETGKRVISIIPVNADTRALSRSFVKLDEIVRYGQMVNIFSERDAFESEILEARFGTEIWKLFVFIALILIIIELLNIKKMEGKNRIKNTIG